MSLKLNSSGGGSVTLQEPVTASNVTLTLPATTGTVLTSATTAGFPAGSVVQVVQGYTATTTTTTSGTAVDTTLSASITPKSATNKVLVLLSSNGYVARGGTAISYGDMYMYIVRGSTSLVNGRAGINFGVNTWNDLFPAQGGYVYLDSPATTSSTTYKMQISVSNGLSLQVPFQSFATITLVEIAA
jgi:hypothetical protein